VLADWFAVSEASAAQLMAMARQVRGPSVLRQPGRPASDAADSNNDVVDGK